MTLVVADDSAAWWLRVDAADVCRGVPRGFDSDYPNVSTNMVEKRGS